MSLIRCDECGKEISDKAEACPHCGCPVNPIKDEINRKDSDNIVNDKYLSYAKELLGKNNSDNVVINELMHNYKELDYDTACNIVKELKPTSIENEEIKKVDEPHIDENLIITDTLEYCQKNRINGNDTGAVKQYIVDKYNIDDERVSIICKKVQDADFKRSLKIVGGVFGVVVIVFILYFGVVDNLLSTRKKDFIGTKWVDSSTISYSQWECYRPTKCYSLTGELYYEFYDKGVVKTSSYIEEYRGGSVEGRTAESYSSKWNFKNNTLYITLVDDLSDTYVFRYKYDEKNDVFVLDGGTKNGESQKPAKTVRLKRVK